MRTNESSAGIRSRASKPDTARRALLGVREQTHKQVRVLLAGVSYTALAENMDCGELAELARRELELGIWARMPSVRGTFAWERPSRSRGSQAHGATAHEFAFTLSALGSPRLEAKGRRAGSP